MKVSVQYIQMPTSDSFTEMVEKKLEKLAKKFPWIIQAEVSLKVEQDRSKHNKSCEIRLSLPGPRIFAKSKSDDFEKATAEVIKELETQLRKRKAQFSVGR